MSGISKYIIIIVAGIFLLWIGYVVGVSRGQLYTLTRLDKEITQMNVELSKVERKTKLLKMQRYKFQDLFVGGEYDHKTDVSD